MKTLSSFIRTLVLFLLCLAIFVAYGLRLMQLQLVDGAVYAAKANQGTERTVPVLAARGEIVDRNGRPLVVNRSCYNIVFDGTAMPRRLQNEIILMLTDIFASQGGRWIDYLPLVEDNGSFSFTEGLDTQTEALKNNLGLQSYATAEHAMEEMASLYSITRGDFLSDETLTEENFIKRYGVSRAEMVERYRIAQEYTPAEMRVIAGVRYEMMRREYSAVTPYTFAEDVSMEVVTRIKENGNLLPGVDVQESTVRDYVSEDIAPHIIGRIGPIYAEEYVSLKEKGYSLNDVVGKEGIEKAFEDQLRGRDGLNAIEYDSSGAIINIRELRAPAPGNTVMLTMDASLQKVAQESLARQIAHLNATAEPGKGKEASAGAVVAVDIKTGEVLVAATYPSYNINDYQKNYSALSQDPLYPLINRALTGRYAPGSTFKPITATAALGEGIITRNTHIMCNRVYTFYEDYQPRCLSAHGNIDVVTALSVSCNVFFYETGRLTGISAIDEYAALYGLGQRTGIELPETVGQVSSPAVSAKKGEQWFYGNVLQASIGQLDTIVTPLQLAQYTATIARKGERLESHLVKGVYSYNLDRTVSRTEPVVAATIEDKNNAFNVVINGMVSCATVGSASAYFGNYPISVAAKTGTPETTEYPNSVFITYAPVENSEIAVAVVIEKGWHGYTGAPVARDIYDAYFAQKLTKTSAQLEETLLP